MKTREIKKIFAIAVLFAVLAQPLFAKKWIGDSNKSSANYEKSITAGCITPSAVSELDLNNVRARIYTGGDMWWDIQTRLASYEVPKNSGKMALYAGAIWIGGTDVNGQLRVAGARYRDGQDYFTGPLIKDGAAQGTTTSDACLKYDKHFIISRDEVSEFRAFKRAEAITGGDMSLFNGYTVPDIITNWPGNNTDADYDFSLAPFFDNDENGVYDPQAGDYPWFDLDKVVECTATQSLRKHLLYGDRTMWWVYNDRGNIHTETDGASIGMEIRAQAFAFATNDELNNMTFGNYTLINRSTYILQDCYFGVWTDADLGDAYDDYVICDVKRGLGILYNGDESDGDGNGATYGSQPPAIGVDFFEGPYMDPYEVNGIALDRPTAWVNGVLNTGSPDVNNGCINGINFGDGVPGNERWGMRRFMYFQNDGSTLSDPATATEYYRFLTGFWKNGVRMTYGGTGFSTGSGTVADFAYPEDTDPTGWGTGGNPQSPWTIEGNTTKDYRFVHSAGPFTLKPGAANDITTGMVWARATSGGRRASIVEVKRADDKAQRLFDNCFKLIDGPVAPLLDIIELDREFIFHIINIKGTNNYMNTPEDYTEKDPFIVCPTGLPNCVANYTFQGYQVFQLKDESSSVTDIGNEDKARLVFQCDKKDTIERIINYEYDNQIGASVPILKVKGNNVGIQHAFTLTDDAFAIGDKRLVNHKTYYYVAIAYGYNNFKTYDPTDPAALDGQKQPYLPSRTGIKSYSVIPHITAPANVGTILNSKFGDGPKIVQIEGLGNGNNELRLTQKTINKIMAGSPWKADSVEYENGYGPIKIKVIDPLNIPSENFGLKFIPSSANVGIASAGYYINTSRWMVFKENAVVPEDTVLSTSPITYLNEQIIPQWGISITINQVPWPAKNDQNAVQNGYISSSVVWADPLKRWIDFVQDYDGCGFPNWIRCGTTVVTDNSTCNDINSTTSGDALQFFEKVIDGTWAPYMFGMEDKAGSATYDPINTGVAFGLLHSSMSSISRRLSSVKVVITKDKTKWTRCPVIETCDYDLATGVFMPGLNEGNAYKFNLRKHASVDKDGNSNTVLAGDSTNPNNSNYIAGRGMGWFPGYAIDVENGERLNMVFGEDSRYPGENGRDMMWNPTANYASDLYFQSGGLAGDFYLGGKHFIYVFGHNEAGSDTMPRYDAGLNMYKKFITITGNAGNTKRNLWWNAMWVSIPMLSRDVQISPSDPYSFIRCDATFNFNIANPYIKATGNFKRDPALVENDDLPYYNFSLKDLVPTINDEQTAKNSLDLIRVVPNPYYGYSAYEKSQLDYKVKITNLPQVCTISIYNVSGTLIRRFKKDSPLSYQDWDLKNEYGITIASGVYIVHIDAKGLGEKIVKWFGALRPLDLNNF